MNLPNFEAFTALAKGNTYTSKQLADVVAAANGVNTSQVGVYSVEHKIEVITAPLGDILCYSREGSCRILLGARSTLIDYLRLKPNKVRGFNIDPHPFVVLVCLDSNSELTEVSSDLFVCASATDRSDVAVKRWSSTFALDLMPINQAV